MNRIIVDADKSSFSLNIRELLSYRDLFYVLSYRDLRVRYAQTFLGLLWAGIQPIATLMILTLIFGRAISVDTGGIPYPLFALAGMTVWNYFSFVMAQSGSSIILAQEMVKKIYFPRIIIPFSKGIVGFVDFLITFLFLMVLMFYYNYTPTIRILYSLLFILLTVLASLGVGVWLSALTIRYRDFQHIVPFMVQLGLYVTPIAYPSTLIPEKYLLYYYINPMAGIVEGFRWSLIGGLPLNQYVYISFVCAFLLFISGLIYFKRTEKIIADIV